MTRRRKQRQPLSTRAPPVHCPILPQSSGGRPHSMAASVANRCPAYGRGPSVSQLLSLGPIGCFQSVRTHPRKQSSQRGDGTLIDGTHRPSCVIVFRGRRLLRRRSSRRTPCFMLRSPQPRSMNDSWKDWAGELTCAHVAMFSKASPQVLQCGCSFNSRW